MGSYVYRVTGTKVTLTNGLQANVMIYAYKPTWSGDADKWNAKWDRSSGCPASRALVRQGSTTGLIVFGRKDEITKRITVEPGSKAYKYSAATLNDDGFFSRNRKVVGVTPGEEPKVEGTIMWLGLGQQDAHVEAFKAQPTWTPFTWED